MWKRRIVAEHRSCTRKKTRKFEAEVCDDVMDSTGALDTYLFSIIQLDDSRMDYAFASSLSMPISMWVHLQS